MCTSKTKLNSHAHPRQTLMHNHNIKAKVQLQSVYEARAIRKLTSGVKAMACWRWRHGPRIFRRQRAWLSRWYKRGASYQIRKFLNINNRIYHMVYMISHTSLTIYHMGYMISNTSLTIYHESHMVNNTMCMRVFTRVHPVRDRRVRRRPRKPTSPALHCTFRTRDVAVFEV